MATVRKNAQQIDRTDGHSAIWAALIAPNKTRIPNAMHVERNYPQHIHIIMNNVMRATVLLWMCSITIVPCTCCERDALMFSMLHTHTHAMIRELLILA